MSDTNVVVRALRELVEALDRRRPHAQRLGEGRIARQAAALRQEAVRRIHHVTGPWPDDDAREAQRSGEVMTDDGAPSRDGDE